MNDGYEFVTEEDGSLTLASAVFQALGAASVCWEKPEGAGIFDSTRAREIGDALIWLLAVDRVLIEAGSE